MGRSTHYWSRRLNDWVDIPDSPPRRRLTIITDTVQPFRSMADGRVYDSKSRYRRELKAMGYEEMGNDKPRERVFEAKDVERDIATAYEQVEAGHKTSLPTEYPDNWQHD